MAEDFSNKTIWGIHAGKTGESDHLFLKKNIVAIGWKEMEDLSGIPLDRESFKSKLESVYPEKKPGAIAVNAGQLFRFVHDMKIGDLVIYPSKYDRKINIGEIKGEYRYDPKLGQSYPNTRSVKWLKSIPRTNLSQGALYEIGSALSIFQVKNYAEEIIAALTGTKVTPENEEDETVILVAEDIEQNTNDFIMKRLSAELKGYPLQDFVAHLLNIMGYRTRVSSKGADGGIDIIAHKDELGFEPPIIKVQVKSSDKNIGDPDVSALYGKVEQDEYGLLVTLGSFTNQAKNFARNKSNLRLIDGEELIEMVLKYYADFDSRYKGLIPLKRVYIPEAIKEKEE